MPGAKGDEVTTVTMRVAAHMMPITHSSAHHPVHLQLSLESDPPRFTLFELCDLSQVT